MKASDENRRAVSRLLTAKAGCRVQAGCCCIDLASRIRAKPETRCAVDSGEIRSVRKPYAVMEQTALALAAGAFKEDPFQSAAIPQPAPKKEFVGNSRAWIS